ncbi:MAG TPA: glycosyltransferase [Thermoleophilaceae bacterium]|nr:glycosyltransferase [Thermoleophilaceae bacterium]
MKSGLQRIQPGRRSLGDYAEVAGDETIEGIRDLAESLAGMRVIHVSAAAPRNGCPELLRALLPLATDAGLDVEWRVVYGSAPFGDVARDLYDGLQGAETAIAPSTWSEYLDGIAAGIGNLREDCDVLVIHDPAALGLLTQDDGGARVVWRCHVDASEPEPATWDRLVPLLDGCDWGVFAYDGFWPPNLGGDVRAIAPAIDPLGPKHMDMPLRLAGHVLRSLGIDLTRPLACHVSRLDRWKDPHGVIDAFAQARSGAPELQLVLVGALPGEGPDDFRIAREVADYAAGIDDVRVMTSYTGVGEVEVGALQRVARVSLQRSLREGFGLAASEALWKRTPVVAFPGGAIATQVEDGTSGYLVGDTQEMAARLQELVHDPGLAIELGIAGRSRVQERFLVTRLLEDELRLLASVSGTATFTS